MGLFSKTKKDDSDKKAGQPVKESAGVAAGQTRSGGKADKKASQEAAKQKSEKKMPISGKANQILIKPLITEKGTFLQADNKYLFMVSNRANKPEIKKALKEAYNVDAVKVNIINMRGKFVRYGRQTGRTKSWKKAVVTLKQGQSIEIFKGV